jgi:phosphate-selective porin OprO/OprP
VNPVQDSAQTNIRFTRLLFILVSCASLNGWCQHETGQSTSVYDRIWGLPVLYSNSDNPNIQSFSLVGRYHGQYWHVNADQGDDSGWENRRKIFGFNSRWLKHLTLEAQAYLKYDDGSLYDGLYVAFVQWEPPDTNISLSAGRLDYLFTVYERSTSSKKINVIERGLLVNQIMPAEVVGAHLQGRAGRFSYHAGLFSRSIEQEFDDFDSGAAAVIGAGYDTELIYDKGKLHLDYLRNTDKSEGNAFRPYRHVVSLWHHGERGRLTVGADLTYAVPLESNGHVFGLTVEPSWMLLNSVLGQNDPLQLTVRFQYVNSSEYNGLHLQRRYEEKVTEGDGDKYRALYAGLNYYLYGHKLKLMMGGEYARMDDDADDGGEYSGWTWFGAVRLYF